MKKDFGVIKREVHELYTSGGLTISEIARRYDNSPSERTIRKWAAEDNNLWRRERFRKITRKRDEFLPENITNKIVRKIDDILSAEGSNFSVKSAENVVKLSQLLEKLRSPETVKLYAIFGMSDFIKYLEIYSPSQISSALLSSIEDYLNFVQQEFGE